LSANDAVGAPPTPQLAGKSAGIEKAAPAENEGRGVNRAITLIERSQLGTQ
jgi:hypothetical protein